MGRESDLNIKALLHLIDDPDEEIYIFLKQKIITLGTAIIPKLEAHWETCTHELSILRCEDLIFELKSEHQKKLLQEWIRSGGNNLLEGALLIAQYQYHNLNTEKIWEFIQRVQQDIWIEINEFQTALEKTKIINHILYNINGFHGDTENFHSPNNSFIHKVIDRKKGTPLSLGILYIHLAQELNIPIYGVNLPHHFVLIYKNEDPITTALFKYTEEHLFYINPFTNGTVFGKAELEEFVQQIKVENTQDFYSACNNLSIIQRMVNNLIFAYEKAEKPNMANHYKKLLILFT